MSFADEKLVALVQSRFTAAWFNHNPGARSGRAEEPQPAWSAEELKLYPEGGGGDNVVLYVATPDGKIVHAIRGWYRPERLVEELEFALTATADGHRARRDSLLAAQERLAREQPAEMAKPHVQSEVRRRHAMLGLLAKVHEDVAPLLGRILKEHLQNVRDAAQGREFS